MARSPGGAAREPRLRALKRRGSIADWCREEGEQGHVALVLTLHVQPGARRSEVVGQHGTALRIRVAAPPVEGKANAELVRFLSAAFDVPARQVTLVRGEASRRKIVRVSDPRRRPDRDWR